MQKILALEQLPILIKIAINKSNFDAYNGITKNMILDFTNYHVVLYITKPNGNIRTIDAVFDEEKEKTIKTINFKDFKKLNLEGRKHCYKNGLSFFEKIDLAKELEFQTLKAL